ncbi:MAG: glycosyltransferase family 4 protein [Bacteroidota bacterium]
MTREGSLKKWDTDGMFDREVALYEAMRDRGHAVTIVTYGDHSDLHYRDRLKGIKILCNRYRWPLEKYEARMPWLFWCIFRKSDLFKTNQTYGGKQALMVARKFNKPLIARCGYMWSEFIKEWKGDKNKSYTESLQLENNLFCGANHVVVTTDLMKDSILGRMNHLQNHISVIPNYVVTDVFKIRKNMGKNFDLLFIGRICEQKNIEPLLQACKKGGWSLKLIGKGPLKNVLSKKYSDSSIMWEDAVPNSDLPNEINSAKVVVLPSLFEGHPKVLIEAMSCEACIVATSVKGIKEIIQDGKNGILSSTDSESLYQNLYQTLSAGEEFRLSIGRNARDFVVSNYALNKIVDIELELYKRLLNN